MTGNEQGGNRQRKYRPVVTHNSAEAQKVSSKMELKGIDVVAVKGAKKDIFAGPIVGTTELTPKVLKAAYKLTESTGGLLNSVLQVGEFDVAELSAIVRIVDATYTKGSPEEIKRSVSRVRAHLRALKEGTLKGAVSFGATLVKSGSKYTVTTMSAPPEVNVARRIVRK